MTDTNLIAWAKTLGFDPDYYYGQPEQEPDEVPYLYPDDGRLSANFRVDEFRCRGTGELPPGGMNPALIAVLQEIRDRYGVPVTINSGYRSRSHNALVGGSPRSQHLYGNAADFVVRGVDPHRVFDDLNGTWAGGLGRYRTFTHIDVRCTRARW
jgi:hypothetical protein